MTETGTSIRHDDLLARIPLFARLSRREIRKLAALCVAKKFESGSVIVEEGTTGLGLFALISGAAEISKRTDEGQVVLATIGPGDILGEMALVDDNPRSATAVAMETTDALLITRSSFQSLVSKDPEIAWCIVPTLAERIRELQDRIIDGGLIRDDAVRSERQSESVDGADGAAEQMAAKEKNDDLAAELLRSNYAFAMSAIAGFSATADAFEGAARNVARETELKSVRAVPRGLISAAADFFREAERIPEHMVAAYRRHRKRS